MLKRLKDLSDDRTLTVHGLRGTFRTRGTGQTDFEEEIVEHCMYHITGGAAEKARMARRYESGGRSCRHGRISRQGHRQKLSVWFERP